MEKEILKTLEGDARLTAKQIAKITGQSEAKVIRTIKKAEADRTILKYKTIINWEKFGNEQVWALIEVKIAPQRDVGFDSIAEKYLPIPSDTHGISCFRDL